MESQQITSFNRDYYDLRYRDVEVDAIVDIIRNPDRLIHEFTSENIAWHALYSGCFSARIRGKRIIEIGAGKGINALLMAALGAEVVTNDISEHSGRLIRAAAKKLRLSNITAMDGDFLELKLPRGYFDLAVGKGLLHHLPHDLEDLYVRRVAQLLRRGGGARFTDPAVNSPLLTRIRLIFPSGDRPSSVLRTEAFRQWQVEQPHPAERSNSSAHFRNLGLRYFHDVKTVPFGAFERFRQVMPPGRLSRQFGRSARGAEELLPYWLRLRLAQVQLTVCNTPRDREAVG